MATTDQRSELTLSTLDKGLTILEALAATDAPQGLTLTELARQLGMHRTTLFRFLATLRARGYVDRDPVTDRYRLGLQVVTLAGQLLNRLDIRVLARDALQALCDRTQELVHLAVLDHGEVVTIERIEGKQPLGLQTGIGARRPAYCTASGKAILAYLEEAELAPILAAGLPRLTPRTLTTIDAMQRELEATRQRGYAIDDEERIEGVRCVAAPVFGYDGQIAAVSIAAPALRMPDRRLHELGEEVRATAEMISQRLGGHGPAIATGSIQRQDGGS